MPCGLTQIKKVSQLKNEVVEAYLENSKIVISDKDSAQRFFEKYFIGILNDEQNILELQLEEALFLLDTGKIRLIDKTRNSDVSMKTLLTEKIKDANIWENYIIYYDLRSRGYVVRKGISEEIIYTVYPRGTKPYAAPPKFYVAKLVEGKPLSLYALRKITQSAKASEKKLVIAVIDRQGDVTYYKVSPMPL